MGNSIEEVIKKIEKDLMPEREVIIEAGIINDKENAKKAMYNEFGTEKIPARPFIKRGLDNIDDIVARNIGKGVNSYSFIGKEMEQNIKKAINKSDYPRNAPSTVKKKGFDFPLIENRDMYNAITFRVTKK